VQHVAPSTTQDHRTRRTPETSGNERADTPPNAHKGQRGSFNTATHVVGEEVRAAANPERYGGDPTLYDRAHKGRTLRA